MAFPRAGSRGGAASRRPGHDLEIEDKYIVEEVIAVPPTEDKHLSASDQVSSVIETSCGGSTTLWALIPGHCYGVEGMKITINGTLGSLTTKDDNS